MGHDRETGYEAWLWGQDMRKPTGAAVEIVLIRRSGFVEFLGESHLKSH